MWHKLFIVVGGLAGCLGVGLGALSRHVYSQRLDQIALAMLDTASHYFLIHGWLLIAIAAWSRMLPDARLLRIAGIFGVTGVMLFCGGLSLAAVTGVAAYSAVAPAGGSALMAAWLSLAVFGLTRY